jgi:hypothetical protein
VIGFPPSSDGALQETTVDVSPASTANPVGAAGAAAGVAVAKAVEKVEVLIPLIAATVKV